MLAGQFSTQQLTFFGSNFVANQQTAALLPRTSCVCRRYAPQRGTPGAIVQINMKRLLPIFVLLDATESLSHTLESFQGAGQPGYL
jgi:hypothetical protein